MGVCVCACVSGWGGDTLNQTKSGITENVGCFCWAHLFPQTFRDHFLHVIVLLLGKRNDWSAPQGFF